MATVLVEGVEFEINEFMRNDVKYIKDAHEQCNNPNGKIVLPSGITPDEFNHMIATYGRLQVIDEEFADKLQSIQIAIVDAESNNSLTGNNPLKDLEASKRETEENRLKAMIAVVEEYYSTQGQWRLFHDLERYNKLHAVLLMKCSVAKVARDVSTRIIHGSTNPDGTQNPGDIQPYLDFIGRTERVTGEAKDEAKKKVEALTEWLIEREKIKYAAQGAEKIKQLG
jgi:hypothetical protein